MTSSLVFVHIPKTAGSTMRQILDRQYDPSVTHKIYGTIRETTASFKRQPADDRAKIRLLVGHVPFGLHEFLTEPVSYLTFLRDPVDRIMSLYYFVMRRPNHYLYKEGKIGPNTSLEEFFARRVTTELDNSQTRFVSGAGEEIPYGACDEALLERAKQNIESRFPVVGLTERFDESVLLMRRRLGWRLPCYQRTNVTSNRPKPSALTPELSDIIRRDNQLDVALYRYAEERLNRQIESAGRPFAAAMRLFPSVNALNGQWQRVIRLAQRSRR